VDQFIFPRSIAAFGSMLNDFAVSADKRYVYIADTSIFRGLPGLVVLDTQSRSVFRYLDSHSSVIAMPYMPKVHGEPVVALGFFPLRPHVDSIALSRDGSYLYYSPVSHDHMFRIPTKPLQTSQGADVSQLVEIYANKSMSDGISLDDQNNLYISDFEHSCINVINPKDKLLTTLVCSEKLLVWPDGFSFGPDNYLYICPSALQFFFRGDDMATHKPFHILKVKLNAGAAAGQ